MKILTAIPSADERVGKGVYREMPKDVLRRIDSGYLDLQKMMGLLGNAGLTVVNSGSIGMNNLPFVLAQTPPDRSIDRPSEA